MSEERFVQRRRAGQRRRRRRILIGVTAGLLAGVLGWIVLFSNVLAVQHVTIDGQTTLSVSQVRSQAAVRLGVPLARVDTTAIQTRVAAIARVERVDVSRHWPHTIRIDVTERTAVAWVRSGLDIRAVDRFGVDYRTLKKEPDSLVEIRVSAIDSRQRQQAMESAAAVLGLLKRSDSALLKVVQHVEVGTKDSVVLNLTKGREVTWGSASKGEQKLRVLRSLLKIKAGAYDVSAPEQPTTRP